MDTLYSKIDAAQKFTQAPEGIPTQDHTEQVNLGLNWAQRQQAQNPPTPDPPKMPAIVPVAN